MKPSATGRILLWRGGSLWIGLAGEPAGFHAHHAVQIALPFPPGRVQFQVSAERGWASYDAAIVAAHQPHAFDARDQFLATIFVEPESREGRGLQRHACEAGVATLDAASLKQPVAALASAYEARASDADLIALARAAISKIAGSQPAAGEPADARVVRAIVACKMRRVLSARKDRWA